MKKVKLLFLSPPIQSGTGGEVIRKRNYLLLKEYFNESFLFFAVPYYAFFPCSDSAVNQQLLGKLAQVLATFQPDILYLDNSLICLPKELFHRYQVMVFYHNIEANYAAQQLRTSPDLAFLARLVLQNEATLTEHADVRICINQRDSSELARLYHRDADYLLPISFADKGCNLSNTANSDYILFVGSDFFGNTEGLFWFISHCLSQISAKLVVIGTGMEKYSNAFPDHNVTFFGFVEDLTNYYQHASCVVLPILSGSGMKTKTCEAFMYGKKVFASPEAMEGYRNQEESGCEICTCAEEYICAINSFIQTDNRSFLPAARNYFLKYYQDSVIKEHFFAFLDRTFDND